MSEDDMSLDQITTKCVEKSIVWFLLLLSAKNQNRAHTQLIKLQRKERKKEEPTKTKQHMESEQPIIKSTKRSII